MEWKVGMTFCGITVVLIAMERHQVLISCAKITLFRMHQSTKTIYIYIYEIMDTQCSVNNIIVIL